MGEGDKGITLMRNGQEFRVRPANPKTPPWRILLDGVEVTASTLVCENESGGWCFVYGAGPVVGQDGEALWNQGSFINRGGAVIVATVDYQGILYCLGLEQVKPLLGDEPIFDFVRGQGKTGEPLETTARREFFEEVGLPADRPELRLVGMENPDPSIQHGVTVGHFWLSVPPAWVTLEGETLRLRKDLVTLPEGKSTLWERIFHAIFVPWMAVRTPSGFAKAAMHDVSMQPEIMQTLIREYTRALSDQSAYIK